MALNTETTDILDINQRKTTVLDGQAQITFDQDRNNRGVTQGSFKGLSLAFSPSQFTVDAPIYENVKDAYDNDEGNHQSQWKVPKSDQLVSLGVVTYTNELVDGEDGNDVGNSQSIIGGGKLGITINDPIGATQKITFPIRIHDQREGPETIALKSTGESFKFLIKGTPIYFDYVGGKPISNATGVGTPTQYKEADPGLDDLSFNFEVQDGTTAQIELFGRLYTTEDLADPVIITSISEDTGVAGDFRTSDNTLFINGTAEPLSEVSVFLDGSKIGTTTTNTTGNWSFDHTGTKLVDGEYELTATATDSTGNSASTNQAQPLTIDTVNSEKVKAPFSGGPSAVKTSKSYDGLVEIDITGTGQAAGTSFSDSFYRFTDSNGNEITPTLAKEFGLYINGEPAELLFPPSQSGLDYSPNNSYNFVIDAPGGMLTFGVGDTFTVDNTGFYDIAIEPI